MRNEMQRVEEALINKLHRWKVYGRDQIFDLESPNGGLGNLHVAEMAENVFRFKLNRYEVPPRSRAYAQRSSLLPSAEVTVTKQEMPAYAEWCADWLLAGTETPPLSAPTKLEVNKPGYIWTAASHALYESSQRRKASTH